MGLAHCGTVFPVSVVVWPFHGIAITNEQALVSLKLKKSVDAEGGRTFAVIIEGG